MNFSKVSFSGLDLSKCYLKDADLRHSICHYTNFKDANLSKANLANSLFNNS